MEPLPAPPRPGRPSPGRAAPPFVAAPRPRASPRPGASPPEAVEDAPPAGRVLAAGADGLPTADLLALLLGAAGSPRGAPAAARRLLGRLGTLRRVASATAPELQAAGGVAPGTAARLSAAFALGRRVHAEPLRAGTLLRTSGAVFEAYAPRLRDLKKERFLAIHLDGRGRVVREDLVSEGILTASLVHPREVFAPALREGAGGLLLVHNHPSGDPEPSPEDHEVTRRLCAVGELVGIRIHDHVVIGDGRYVSFLERGLLPPP